MLFYNLVYKPKFSVAFPKTYRRHQFHGSPVHSDENGTTGTKRTPTTQIKLCQGPTGTSLSSDPRDPARERADIPPGGARSRTSPPGGTGRQGLTQVQQINPPFLITAGQKFSASASHAGTKHVSRRLRGESHTRSIRRGGCLFPASFSCVLEAGDRKLQNRWHARAGNRLWRQRRYL